MIESTQMIESDTDDKNYFDQKSWIPNQQVRRVTKHNFLTGDFKTNGRQYLSQRNPSVYTWREGKGWFSPTQDREITQTLC